MESMDTAMSANQKLCSEHFEASAFDKDPALLKEIGLKVGRVDLKNTDKVSNEVICEGKHSPLSNTRGLQKTTHNRGIGKKTRSCCQDVWLHWDAASCKDDEFVKVDKWLSVGNHVANKHEGHSKKIPHCEHRPLEEEQHWLKEGPKPYKAFMDIVSSSYLVRDLRKPSPVYQTHSLEVFHNVVNHFAPKHTHHFHVSIVARMDLAALHYNENGDHQQARDVDGNLKWKMVYPKTMKGDSAVDKPIKTVTTFGYDDDLCKVVIERRLSFENYSLTRENVNAEMFYLINQNMTKTFTPFKKDDIVAKRQTIYQCQL